MSAAQPVPTQSGPRLDHERGKLWSRPYLLLCATLFASCVHHAVLEPVLPLYVVDNGGSLVVAGLALAAFSTASFGLRPLVGFGVDRLGPRAVVLAGTAILVLAGAAFLVPALALLFVANAIRGVGWAGMNTSCYALLSLVSPASRRGEASVYYTVAGNASGIFAPALGLWLIAGPTGFSGAFGVAVAAALVAHLAAHFLAASTGGEAGPTESTTGGVSVVAFVDTRVLPVSLLLICLMVANASNAFVPLLARERGIEHVGLFFAAASLVGIGSRLMLGRFTDRGARELWIAVGFVLAIAGLAVIREAAGTEQLVLGGAIFALGMAAASPLLLALAIDVGDSRRPGAAMATFSASFQIGPAIGAPSAGWLIQTFGYEGMYVAAILVAAAGLALTLRRWRARRPKEAP